MRKTKLVQQSELDLWTIFLNAMRAPMTRDRYKTRVAKFFNFIGIRGKTLEQKARSFANKGKNDSNWALINILKFVYYQRERVNKKEISAATLINYIKSIKLFCEMADVPIQWKKITRGLPKGKKYADDRIPTLQELRKLIEYPDRRIKAIVFTMASSGTRVGFWDYLRWSDITPIERNGEVMAAKMIVYAGEDEQYFTFISPAAWQELSAWRQYREASGEIINRDSWVMRDLWDTRVAHGRGLATVPKKLTSLGVKRLMERAIWAQGLRNKLEPGKKRHPFQANHSLRKWFKTRCEIAGMKPINVEILMNHSVGISDSYYRITEAELLDDYLSAVEFLSINGNETKLKKEISDGEKKIEISKPVYTKDSSLPYLGKNHKIQVKILDYQKRNNRKVEKNSVKYNYGLFVFHIQPRIQGNQESNDEIKILYENWLNHKAKIIFKEKVHILSKAIGVKVNKVVIKNLKNRWASITKNNDINLNVNLVKAPPEIIDYIIIHELCHFKIKGHSYSFWNLLRRYIPDYPKFIEWLNINGKNLLS